MSAVNTLEQTGNLTDFPAAELLHQAVAAAWSGTFHLTSGAQKVAVYLSEGAIVFAASNVRGHRLAFKLMQWRALPEPDLSELINLPEPELARTLVETGKLTADALEDYRARQVAEILLTALGWTTGEYAFNPFVRARENMRVKINLPEILSKAARLLPADFVRQRFEQDSSTFDLPAPETAPPFDLLPEEAYLLSRFDDSMNAHTAAMLGGLPFEKTCQILYALWLGGALRRHDYAKAFDDSIVEAIRAVKLAPSQKSVLSESKTETAKPVAPAAVAEQTLNSNELSSTINEKLPEILPPIEVSEEEQVQIFLARVETANTFYQILGVINSTDAPEIKKAYFQLAKQFHPDKFHSVGGETHVRLQNAFTRLAQAYETLKDTKNRELYDFKLSKQASISGNKTEVSQFTPAEIYQSGVKELQGGNYNQAVAYLQRAVQLAPDVAEYQARLGQALAVNPKFRHQAEEKMQQAIKLDEKNADWRLLLAEYYIAIGLNKRAEGELNRLLSIYPNHPAAQQMFANLR